jgi:hypothetical protein
MKMRHRVILLGDEFFRNEQARAIVRLCCSAAKLGVAKSKLAVSLATQRTEV